MLRISTIESDTEVTLLLEGRLAGEWVTELETIASGINPGTRRLAVDLRQVTGASAEGLNLLLEIRDRGGLLTHASPYLSLQLNRGR